MISFQCKLGPVIVSLNNNRHRPAPHCLGGQSQSGGLLDDLVREAVTQHADTGHSQAIICRYLQTTQLYIIVSLHNNVHFSSQAYDKCRSYAILCHCTEDKCIQKIRFLGCSPFFWSYSVGNFLFSNQFSHECLSLLNVGRIIDDFLFQCLLAVLLHYHQYTNINYT